MSDLEWVRGYELMSTGERLQWIIGRLKLVSHVSAANAGQASRSTDEDVGGRRPSGGIVGKDDREPGFDLKSADYFIRRMARCRTERAMVELLAEAERALRAWRRTPAPAAGIMVERGSFFWKCQVADDPREANDVKRVYMVSRATVYRYRLTYRGLRKTTESVRIPQ